MSRLPLQLKEKAVILRKKGYSIKEISDKLNIAKSTSSLWLRSLILNKKAKKRLIDRQLIGYYKTALRWQKKNLQEETEYQIIANNLINKIEKDIYHFKLFCALLYWCEGGKSSSDVRFTNSDPLLIKTFVNIFRKSFIVDENKFRILMHLHGYHDENIQKKFWSKITEISANKFQKTYHKINSGKRVREGYEGCITVKYYDAKILKELKAIYKSFFEKLGA